jgi:hypothetical protein
MYRWVLVLGLGCAEPPVPVVPAIAPVEVLPQAPPVVPAGPSRAETVQLLQTKTRVRVPGLAGGWTRVGTHLEERVLKPVCGGEVPRLGVKLDGLGGRLHAFDGHRMVVYEILGMVRAGEGAWRAWVVPSGSERPVHTLDIGMPEPGTTRWRGTAPDWADGADWVIDARASELVLVEQLECRRGAQR